MNTSPNQTLAAEVEAAVLSTTGVTSIFPTGTTASKLTDAGARIIGIRKPDDPLVRIESTDSLVSVEFNIGVTGTVGAIDTLNRVHALIKKLCVESIGKPAVTRITVAYIETDSYLG